MSGALWLSLAIFVIPTFAADDGVTAFVGATIIDATDREPLINGVVVVEGPRIVAVGPSGQVKVPAGGRVVDARGKWIVPGLIDAHVHFFQSGSLYTRPDIIDLRRIRPYLEEIAWIRQRIPQTLARYLASGVTSVADVAGPRWTFEVREQAQLQSTAPRVALSGPGLAPLMPREWVTEDPPMTAVASPEQARVAVRNLLEAQPDLLKIWFPLFRGMDLEQEMRWVKVAIDESHAHNLRVGVHATQLALARRMVEAGADILVHSVDDELLDEDFLRLLKARGVIYIPTLVVREGYQEVLGNNVTLSAIERQVGDPQAIATFGDLRRWYPEWPQGRVRGPGAVMLKNLKRLHDYGITVAAGSDAGNIGTLHGPALHRELELMARAGLTPHEVLITATRGGARLLGRESELGTIEVGKLADFLILDANPLEDIRNTHRIHRVVKDGVLFDPDEILNELQRNRP
ncbi:MAG: amidohydrolase family protein [Chromatiales bacterium]|nr:amidohydrolase family protein [Chromatiales bacterium]